MKKLIALLLFTVTAFPGFAQKGRKAAKTEKPEKIEVIIRAIMTEQEKAWNKGDLEGFMAAYWPSDSLMFIGSRGLTYGWRQTLENYRKAYPDRQAMGKLTFTVLSIERLSLKNAFVVGKWQLERKSGDLSGYYTLLWRKIKGNWLIVADHSN